MLDFIAFLYSVLKLLPKLPPKIYNFFCCDYSFFAKQPINNTVVAIEQMKKTNNNKLEYAAVKEMVIWNGKKEEVEAKVDVGHWMFKDL